MQTDQVRDEAGFIQFLNERMEEADSEAERYKLKATRNIAPVVLRELSNDLDHANSAKEVIEVISGFTSFALDMIAVLIGAFIREGLYEKPMDDNELNNLIDGLKHRLEVGIVDTNDKYKINGRG